jgi:excisionase family DNA binding protein
MNLLTIGEAARRLNLAVDTVRRLEQEGVLKATRTRGGHRRFREDVIEAFARRNRPAARRAKRIRRSAPRPPARREPANVFNDPIWRDDSDPDLDDLPEDPDPDAWLDDLPEDDPDDYPDQPVPAQTTQPPPRVPQVPAWAEALSKFKFEVPTMKQPTEAEKRTERLKRLKATGVAAIPYDTPASERSKVIADLEKYVTAERLPDWVSDLEATRIVQGHVQEILQPYREQAEREASQAANEKKRQQLIDDGLWHARMNTITGWDDTPAEEAREAGAKALRAEVTSTWSTRRVRDRVDEILADWDDEDED